MIRKPATEIQVGDTVITWYGLRRVNTIEPYVGVLDAAGIVRFDDETGMTFSTATYGLSLIHI